MNESTLVSREEISDLDWLARNVHAWPCDPPFGTTLHWDGRKSGDANYISVYSEQNAGRKYTKRQWIARRAELQNKPRWGKHGWPQIFQNEDGHWFGARAEWDFKAHISGGWKGDGVSLLRDDGEYLQSGTILGDWRDTLEKRPEQAEFEPFISVEDAATARQPAPKGSGSPILGMVLADLTNRALEGKEKYGEPLLAHNGRRSVVDLLQELYDAAMYCRQLTEELSDLGGDLKSCIHAVAEVKCLEGEELAKHVSLLKLISSKSSALLAR